MLSVYKLKLDQPLTVAAGPHLRSTHSVQQFMWGTASALIPIWIASLIFFGWSSFRVLALATGSAVGFEWLFQRAFQLRISVHNGSGFLLGAVFAFLLPASVPSMLVLLGAFFAVIVGKEFLGGLGQNLLHPALVSYVLLLTLFPAAFGASVSAPTSGPLALEVARVEWTELWRFFLGCPRETLGGASIVAVWIGGLIEVVKKWARFELPFFYLATVMIGTMAIGQNRVGDLFPGAIFFAAFFILTDTVTSPVTRNARMVFAVGCGLLTLVVRFWTAYDPLAIACAVLIMNACVPALDRAFRSRRGAPAW
ncbi:MAG: hypothetical protein A3G87_04820 [Omnitrophica bacterium RIFCSPLOWO2_12_FULL_50_11]|nr:MAG: hypothetical protein A3G87_04820 [Omnitrophica bacterium RIFCSPLOWO2_12_FULL_50_11]